MAAANGGYYIPHGTKWPIMGSIGLFTLLGGFAMVLNGNASANWIMVVGALIIVAMMIGWFGTVIGESEAGTYNAQVDLSFRQGMIWFIFSEVLFFGAFFGALFYARIYSVPWLAGEGAGGIATGPFLWPGYEGAMADERPWGHRRCIRDHPRVRHPLHQHHHSGLQRRHRHPRALGTQEKRAGEAVLVACS